MSFISKILAGPIQAVEDKLQQAKEDAQLELSEVIAKLILFTAAAFITLLIAILLSVGIAGLINTRMNHPYFGYLIVAGFYLLLLVILLLSRKSEFMTDTLQTWSNRIVFGASSGTDEEDEALN